VIDAFWAWIKNISGKDFCSKRLTTATQNNAFSCGMLAVNALEHHIHPDTIPLLNTTQCITLDHLWKLDKALSIHMNGVSYALFYVLAN